MSFGRARGGYPDNSILRVPITPVHHDLYDATVCLRNPGLEPLKFAGNRTPTAGVRIPGPEAIRYDWLLAGRPSWWDVAPRVAARFAVVKPGFVESWTVLQTAAQTGRTGPARHLHHQASLLP